MKHEACSIPIKVSVGLIAKMYTYITEDNHECKKQGLNKNIVDDELECKDH